MDSYSTAELALYAIICIPVVYNLFKHGPPGLVGWLYLFAFCSLRIIGGVLAIKESKTAAIIANIGLSPLLLATIGLLGESKHYRCNPSKKRYERITILMYHLVVISGVALLAVGGSALQKPGSKMSDLTLVKVGIAIITACWVFLVGWIAKTILQPVQIPVSPATFAGIKILYAVSFSSIFIGIRIIYALVALVSQNKKLNPTSGLLAVRVVLSFLPELLAALILMVVGLITRNIRVQRKNEALPDGTDQLKPEP